MIEKWKIKESITPAELAWCAGIIDGEGCIGIYARAARSKSEGRGLALVIEVGNTDIRMPLKLQELLGGNYAILKCPSRGEKRRPAFQWTVTGKHAGRILVSLMPYFVVKKEQAEIGIAFASTMTDGGPLPIGIREERQRLKAAAHQMKLVRPQCA